MYLILVVDDHIENCTPLVKLFRYARIEALTVASGRAALAAMAVRRPDVVLLDLMMPEMDGFEVLEQIRSDPHFNPVVVLMYSAVTDLECQMRSAELGAQGYVVKGTPFADLRAEVDRHLAAR